VKLARIVPPQWEAHFPTEEYRMALAHWVLEEPETYPKYLKRGAKYIIIDNGSFEDEPVSVENLNNAAAIIKADEVILPDVLGNAKETLHHSWKALGQIATKRVMFVPQGHTLKEWRECLRTWLAYWKENKWSHEYELAIGLSSLRMEGSKMPQVGTRVQLIPPLLAATTSASGGTLPFHLLGVGNPKEFAERELPAAFQAGARGVDTSLAFAVGAEGKLLTPNVGKVRLGSPESYPELSTWIRRLIFLNLHILSEWVTNGFAGIPNFAGAHASIHLNAIPTFWIRQTASKWLKFWAEGFCDLPKAMETCGMPPGKYALLKEKGREVYVRQLTQFQAPTGKETLITIGIATLD